MIQTKLLLIVPTLNSYPIICRLINSLKIQKYKNWRVVFVDNSNNKCVDNLMKPFMLQWGFHYILFMEYNDCDCVSYPTDNDVGMCVNVSRFY